ncbi:hypothetical protein HX13_12220 [Chryseobacterium sp. P1-3]|nr:hypothetical protein HX13_12220 [Chryseobacterium sp. P1-3]
MIFEKNVKQSYFCSIILTLEKEACITINDSKDTKNGLKQKDFFTEILFVFLTFYMYLYSGTFNVCKMQW